MDTVIDATDRPLAIRGADAAAVTATGRPRWTSGLDGILVALDSAGPDVAAAVATGAGA
jgi:hypothetical protein